jgi:hypothetical protein
MFLYSGELARVRHRRLILVLSAVHCEDLLVFGDESQDLRGERVFAIAGLMGSEDDWKPLEDSWLERTGGRIFHANNCDSDHGEYSKTSHSENKCLYKDLVVLIAKSKLIGFGSALSIPDYKAAFPDDLEDHPYLVCFADVLKYFTQVARVSSPPGVSRFTFHRRPQIEHNAGEIYNYFCGLPEWQPFMGKSLTFESDESVRIQAADLVTRESMKHLDNQVSGSSRTRRGSWVALEGAKRFKFMEYRRDSFERMKERRAQLGAADIPAYRQWLAERKLQHNMTNRIRFMNFCDPAGRYGTRWG